MALLRRGRPRHRRHPVRGDRPGAQPERAALPAVAAGQPGQLSHPSGNRPVSRAAVLGRPVSHSLSPLLHRAAYAALGLTGWTYDALDLGADDLPVLLAGLGPEWRGFSVTMPCKAAAVDAADEADPL